MMMSEEAAGTAFPAKHLPATTAMRGTFPESRPQAAKEPTSRADATGKSVSLGRPPPPSVKNTVAASAAGQHRADDQSCGDPRFPGYPPSPGSHRRVRRTRPPPRKMSPLILQMPPARPSAGV